MSAEEPDDLLASTAAAKCSDGTHVAQRGIDRSKVAAPHDSERVCAAVVLVTADAARQTSLSTRPSRTVSARYEADARPSRFQHRPVARRGGLVVRLLLAAVAGLALAATVAPLEQHWLLPLAVALFTATVHRMGGRTALLVGYVFGASYLLALTSWMRAVGTDAWMLIALAVAGYYALLALAVARASRLPAWPVWTACLWVGVEALVSAWPLGGFPWSRLAWATVDTPLSLWLPWIGAGGVSFLAALLGSILCWLVLTIKRRTLVALGITGGLLATLYLPLLVRPESLTPGWEAEQPRLQVAVVQGNVPGTGTDLVAHHRQVTRNHLQATLELAHQVSAGEQKQPDLVLWPENSTAVDPFRDSRARQAITRAVTAIKAPILVGAIVEGPRPDTVRNQGLVWLPEGASSERYTKRHPVPFGEYIPFRSWLSGLRIGRLDMIPRDMLPGTRTRPLDVAGAQVADVICFDIAFDDAVTAQVRKGGQLVTVQTSNATFTGTAQLEQQFAISRLRALETGRTVVVASTNGISGVIGPDGAVRTRLEPRTTDVALARVALVDRQTPAVRYGTWIQRTLSLLGIGALVATAVARRRRTTAR